MSRFQISAFAFGFFIVAAVTRFALYLVESRIQIAAFWVLAALAGGLLPRMSGRRSSLTLVLACGIAATLGVLLLKWILEDEGYWGVRLALSNCRLGNCHIRR